MEDTKIMEVKKIAVASKFRGTDMPDIRYMDNSGKVFKCAMNGQWKNSILGTLLKTYPNNYIATITTDCCGGLRADVKEVI